MPPFQPWIIAKYTIAFTSLSLIKIQECKILYIINRPYEIIAMSIIARVILWPICICITNHILYNMDLLLYICIYKQYVWRIVNRRNRESPYCLLSYVYVHYVLITVMATSLPAINRFFPTFLFRVRDSTCERNPEASSSSTVTNI